MIADEQTAGSVRALVEQTYAALSTPGADFTALFGAADIAVSGSGQGELWSGPEQAVGAATVVASWGFGWSAEDVTVWREGDVAWARVLGSVRVARDGVEESVPYWTTAVFGLEQGSWRWRYWGGSEPQESPKV